MKSMADIFAALFSRETRKYQPKFCRARGCNQLMGHDGRHTGKHRQPLQIAVPRATAQRHGKFYGDHIRSLHGRVGTNHGRLHHPRRPRTTSVASQQRMAEYRRRPVLR